MKTISTIMPNIPQIDSIVAETIDQRVWPGAVVMASQAGELVHAAAYGTTMYADPGSRSVQLDTRYDIASLTKVFTATAALQLIDEGRIDLDAPAARYLDQLRATDVSVRHLLTHTSGLDIRLSALRNDGRAGILDAVYAVTPTRTPGSAVAYTNVNSLLLGEIVESIRAMPLQEAITRFVLQPLDLQQTEFLPADWLRNTIAPTEWDDEWRRGLVHGTVHDESAHALGGVAGHAGLFSSAHDILRFCEVWLSGGAPLLTPTRAASAVHNHTPQFALACGLGWMLDRPNFMGNAPAGSYGHTGFTGPAMIIVPHHGCCVVVLANRTYPHRSAPVHHSVIGQIVTATLQACS